MNIINEENSYDKDILLPVIAVVFIGMCLTLLTYYLTKNLDYAAITGVNVMLISSLIVIKSWNKEIKSDSYAALNTYFTVQVGYLFISLVYFPFLSDIVATNLAVFLTIVIVVSHIFVTKRIAFMNVDNAVYETDVYYGVPVAYTQGGDYIEHIESLATDNATGISEDSNNNQ